MGLEHAYVPLNFDRLHYLTFSFPYSHGFVASVIWSRWRSYRRSTFGGIDLNGGLFHLNCGSDDIFYTARSHREPLYRGL